MHISRKCPACNGWTDNADYCSHCGKLLNYHMQREQEVAQKDKEYKERQLDAMEKALANMKASANPFVRAAYYVVYSVWFTFVVVSSFIISLIVAAAG